MFDIPRLPVMGVTRGTTQWGWSAGARTGIETARWLKQVCDVPIVFVTAHSDDSSLERIHDVVPGAPVLSKPVYRDTLAHAVSEAVH